MHTFADSLHGAHLTPIFHSVKGEINLWDGLLLTDRPECIVDLDLARNALVRHDGVILAFHDREGSRNEWRPRGLRTGRWRYEDCRTGKQLLVRAGEQSWTECARVVKGGRGCNTRSNVKVQWAQERGKEGYLIEGNMPYAGIYIQWHAVVRRCW